jgi:hypothetical protein
MPPQQPQRLLDVFGDGLHFGAHVVPQFGAGKNGLAPRILSDAQGHCRQICG